MLTYLQHRITNAGLEVMNTMTRWVRCTAPVFWNAEYFNTAIYFHRGG
jgi:hypothetical protein